MFAPVLDVNGVNEPPTTPASTFGPNGADDPNSSDKLFRLNVFVLVYESRTSSGVPESVTGKMLEEKADA